MKYSVYRFTLDIHVTRSQVSIPVPYGDTGIRFLISLSDGGKPYTIEKGCIAVFFGKKADGNPLLQPCIINHNSEIQYDFTEQTASYEGIVDCEIRLFGTDGNKITSPSFNIVVDSRVLREEDLIESEAEKSYLDTLIQNTVNKTLPEGVTSQVIESDIEIEGDLNVRGDIKVNDKSIGDFVEKEYADDTYATKDDIAKFVDEDDADDKYLQKDESASDMPQIYGKNADGSPKMFNVSSNIGSGRIVQRTNSGQINVPDTPERDSSAVNKGWVERLIYGIEEELTAINEGGIE